MQHVLPIAGKASLPRNMEPSMFELLSWREPDKSDDEYDPRDYGASPECVPSAPQAHPHPAHPASSSGQGGRHAAASEDADTGEAGTHPASARPPASPAAHAVGPPTPTMERVFERVSSQQAERNRMSKRAAAREEKLANDVERPLTARPHEAPCSPGQAPGSRPSTSRIARRGAQASRKTRSKVAGSTRAPRRGGKAGKRQPARPKKPAPAEAYRSITREARRAARRAERAREERHRRAEDVQRSHQPSLSRKGGVRRKNTRFAIVRSAKAPPFHTYGRGNTHPVSGGLIYGDYLRSFNTGPHTYPNRPDERQVFLSVRESVRTPHGPSSLMYMEPSGVGDDGEDSSDSDEDAVEAARAAQGGGQPQKPTAARRGQARGSSAAMGGGDVAEHHQQKHQKQRGGGEGEEKEEDDKASRGAGGLGTPGCPPSSQTAPRWSAPPTGGWQPCHPDPQLVPVAGRPSRSPGTRDTTQEALHMWGLPVEPAGVPTERERRDRIAWLRRVRDAGGGQEAVQAAYEQSMKSACIPECDPLRPVTAPETRRPPRGGAREGAGGEQSGPRVYRPRHTAPPEPQVSMWELLQWGAGSGAGGGTAQPRTAAPVEGTADGAEVVDGAAGVEQDPSCPCCEQEAGE